MNFEKGNEMTISKWEKTKLQYEELRKAGRLSEIEDLPDEIEKRAANVTQGIFKMPYKTLKEYRKTPNQAA